MTEEEALRTLRGDDVAAAAHAADALWGMWHRSGDARLDGMLRDGIEAMERQDLDAAEAVFTRLIETAPTFAEGWNKRATVRYMAENYPASIADCRQTLARNPHHFGEAERTGQKALAPPAWSRRSVFQRRDARLEAEHPSLEAGDAPAVLVEPPLDPLVG